MLPEDLKNVWKLKIEATPHPRELVVDLLFDMQAHYGFLSDEALDEAAKMLGVDPMSIEQIATFYTFLFREPLGRYVIHVCDSVVCWMDGFGSLRDFLKQELSVELGETTSDGLFTLLPVCCIGYCDRAPAILINKKVYGELTPEKLRGILSGLREEAANNVEAAHE